MISLRGKGLLSFDSLCPNTILREVFPSWGFLRAGCKIGSSFRNGSAPSWYVVQPWFVGLNQWVSHFWAKQTFLPSCLVSGLTKERLSEDKYWCVIDPRSSYLCTKSILNWS